MKMWQEFDSVDRLLENIEAHFGLKLQEVQKEREYFLISPTGKVLFVINIYYSDLAKGWLIGGHTWTPEYDS